MNGYLQRIALSAVKPGESIQPVLGSVFSPPNYPTGLEALSVETTQRVARPGLPESQPRADSRASLNNDPRADALRAHEPSPEGRQPAGLAETPIPISNQLFTPLVSGPGEEAETVIVPRTLAKSGDERQEMSPAESAQFAKAPTSTSNHSSLPPGSKEKAEALTLALLPKQSRDQNREAAMKLPHERTAGAPVTQKIAYQVAEIAPTESAQFKHLQRVLHPRCETTVGAAPEQKVEHQTGKIAHGKAVFSAGTATKREVDRSGAQLATTTAVAKPDFRRFVAPTPAIFTSGAEGKEKMVSLRRGTPREPDEIQIHIGRIEVIAVPPAPAPPAPQKPRRGAPSLDEYLRRRDGKSV